MSRGVTDLSQVLSRKQILLAFGRLVVEDLDEVGLINYTLEGKLELAVDAQTSILTDRVVAEAIEMGLAVTKSAKRKRK
jgi:hypothetical protein